MPRFRSALCLFLITACTVRVFDANLPVHRRHARRHRIPLRSYGRSHDSGSEFVRLAPAIPADKYTWHLSPDVRTIAEIFLYARAANYNLCKLVGTPIPSTVDTKTVEQSTTDKAKIIATLRASYARGKAAIRAMSDADLEKTLDRRGVAPPWTTDPRVIGDRFASTHVRQSFF